MNVPIRKLKTKIPASLSFVVFLFVLINLAGSVCSATARRPSATTKSRSSISSDSAPVAPSITSQPISQTVNPGQTATFIVVATGTAPLTYQWMLNGAAITGATSPAYTTPAAAVEDNGAQFSVKISNPIGNATSSSAKLTVNVVLPPEQSTASVSLENQRVRFSRFLSNSYIGVQIGSIGYAFSPFDDIHGAISPIESVFFDGGGNPDHNFTTASGSVPAESDAGGSPISVVSVGEIDQTQCSRGNCTGSVETFSSQGPTEATPQAQSRMKPDVIAADGVSLTGAGGFGAGNDLNTALCASGQTPCFFFGTSAAAPHAAAIAALVLQSSIRFVRWREPSNRTCEFAKLSHFYGCAAVRSTSVRSEQH